MISLNDSNGNLIVSCPEKIDSLSSQFFRTRHPYAKGKCNVIFIQVNGP